jgi:hypothetical protein
VAKKNASYYFAFGALSTVALFLTILIVYLKCKFSQLGTENLIKRVGSAYNHLETAIKTGYSILAFFFLSFARGFALAFVMTFGISSFVGQLFYTNFSSILLLSFVGIFRPFKSKLDNILDMLNEFTILVLCCLMVTQTDFILQITGRNFMGWPLICVICLNIAVSLGCIVVQDISVLCRKLKLHYLKRNWENKMRLLRERKLKIDCPLPLGIAREVKKFH